MSIEMPAQFNDLIEHAEYAWFATVRADGMPQPTPVWFIREGDSFLIYTIPGSQKVNNLEASTKVALSWANADAGEYWVIMGEASIDTAAPPANQNPRYLAKYRDGIVDINMTPKSFSQQFSLPIRLIPVHVRGATA